jgi:hypothetical protein
MLYFKVLNGKISEIAFSHQSGPNWVSRHDFDTFEKAVVIAELATSAFGVRYIATDTNGTLPRFDVIVCPQVGDKVSTGFNGDYTPEGEIVSISKSLKLIKTSTGSKFYRRKSTAQWIKNGFQSMVSGHIYERNPQI